MEFGKLATHNNATCVGQHIGKRGKRSLDTMWRFVEDNRPLLERNLFKECLATFLMRQESKKYKLARVDTGNGERGSKRRGSRNRFDSNFTRESLAHKRNKFAARIAYAGRTGVRHERNALPFCKQC
jgi:hypothetical protein